MRLVVAVVRALVAEAARHLSQMRDDFRRHLDRVDTRVHQRGMAFVALDPADVGALALVRGDHPHLGRLADDADEGLDRQIGEVPDQSVHADATDLLVMGEGEIDRCLQAAGQHLGHIAQGDGDEGLHVRGAATIQQPLPFDHRPGVALPFLAVHRHHVGMAGEHDAGLVVWPKRRIEIGLGTAFVVR